MRARRNRRPRPPAPRPHVIDSRYHDLKRVLLDRKRETLALVLDGMREARAEGFGHDDSILDAGEASAVNSQQDVAFAVIQIHAETLHRLDAALARLAEGVYGRCFECGQDIAEPRLRALPFAVRCKDCEEGRERAARAAASHD
jgi:DnaK suppressor protein